MDCYYMYYLKSFAIIHHLRLVRMESSTWLNLPLSELGDFTVGQFESSADE